MAYYPLFFDFSQQPVLIVGGGHAAFEKLSRLSRTGAVFFIAASRVSEPLASLVKSLCRQDPGRVHLEEREWQESDLNGKFLVIAATDDPKQNARIASACKARHLLCSVVDSARESDVIFGSVILENELSIGISTSGASPSAAVWLRKQIEILLPEAFDSILVWLKAIRPQILKTVGPEIRPALFRALFQACLKRQRPLDPEELHQLLATFGCPM